MKRGMMKDMNNNKNINLWSQAEKSGKVENGDTFKKNHFRYTDVFLKKLKKCIKKHFLLN